MVVDVVMPQMGESIFEGTIIKWLKKPGERIERDEPLFEISTDKVDAEIPAPVAGVLREIKVAEGQTVPIQTVVAVIDASATESSGAAPAAPGIPKEATQALKEAPAQAPPAAAAPAKPAAAAGEREAGSRHIRSSPLARRLARENNVDLSALQGSGAGGRISKQDVLTASKAGAQGKTIPPTTTETGVPRERIYFGKYAVQPLSAMRQRIAEHMILSKRVSPHVYSMDEVDMTRICEARDAAAEEFQKRNGTKLTFMPFFIRACTEALREFPVLNASLDGSSLVLHGEINVGIAVALEEGLIVPVVLNADEKNFLGLQRAVNDLAERARNKKLNPDEVQHSTFTITNPGIFGGLMGLPIINQPNLAILAVGAIQKRPVVIENAIVIRSMAYLTMSYDHRAVDGATAHKFLGTIKNRLETWSEALL